MERQLVLDVSRWDDGINLAAWKSRHDLWGVIIKCGGNEGGRYRDRLLDTHYANARAAGLHVGFYYYTTVTDATSAAEDAEHALQLIGGRDFDLPVYIDVEDAGQATIGRRALTDVCLSFIHVVERAGHRGGLYTSGSWWQNNVYADELRPYANWIAWWTGSKPSAIADVGMWQFGSMRLSDGDVQHDDVSGYTDANYCYVDYPAKHAESGGGTVGKLLSYQDMIAEAAEHYAYHDAHGYSQPNRAGDGTIEELRYSDGTPMRIRGGDKDCSEDVRACLAAAGLVPWDYWESYTWTENEDEVLTSHGFVRLAFDWGSTQRGDILWVEGHTGVALGNGLQADAHGDEYGGIDGPNEGDQTGHEIEVRDLQWYWTYTYRYVGPERPQPAPKPKPEQRPGDPKNSAGIKYRAHVQTAGWFPAVRDGQTAGTEGFSARMEAIKISPPEGVVLDAMAHLQGKGDTWFRGIKAGPRSGIGSSDIDPIIGTVGESRRVEGIEIDVVEWPKSLRGKWLYYQVHLQGIGWCDPVRAGTFAGTRGESRRLEAVRIWIE